MGECGLDDMMGNAKTLGWGTSRMLGYVRERRGRCALEECLVEVVGYIAHIRWVARGVMR